MLKTTVLSLTVNSYEWTDITVLKFTFALLDSYSRLTRTKIKVETSNHFKNGATPKSYTSRKFF